MLTAEKIEQFYKDVESIALKKPVAAIPKATGDDKSNVSKYLARKKEPSEEFLQRFYEKVFSGSKVVSRETQEEEEPDLKQIIRMQNALIQTQNRILAEIKDGIQDKVSNIEVNLNQHRGVVNSIALQVDAVGREALKSLSRLEKRDENFLLKEAGKRIEQKMKEMSKQNNMAASGR